MTNIPNKTAFIFVLFILQLEYIVYKLIRKIDILNIFIYLRISFLYNSGIRFKEVMHMEIRNTRYQELLNKEIAFDVIKDFIQRERGEISDKVILDHITWLISTVEEEEK